MARNADDSETKVGRINSKAASLKATIPSKVVKELELEEGDMLEWKVQKNGGKPFAIVRRKRYRSVD